MKKHFCEQEVFGFIWDNADTDGIWSGDANSWATEFGVTPDESYSVLSDLCDQNRIQKLEPSKYIVTRWPERDDPEK